MFIKATLHSSKDRGVGTKFLLGGPKDFIGEAPMGFYIDYIGAPLIIGGALAPPAPPPFPTPVKDIYKVYIQCNAGALLYV